MIIKFKLFEFINDDKPKLKDYVIVTVHNEMLPTIGRITHIAYDSSFPYLVEFDKNFYYYDYGLDDNNVVLDIDEILYWSKDKEELKPLLQSNKYNL
jgi:hypothetical protein